MDSLDNDSLLSIVALFDLWDLTVLLGTSKRLRDVASYTIEKRCIVDMRFPLPMSSEDEPLIVESMQKFILRHCGSSLKQLKLNEDLYSKVFTESFMSEFALRCPQLRCLPVDNSIKLIYAMKSRKAFKEITIQSKRINCETDELTNDLFVAVADRVEVLNLLVRQHTDYEWIIEVLKKAKQLRKVFLRLESEPESIFEHVLKLIQSVHQAEVTIFLPSGPGNPNIMDNIINACSNIKKIEVNASVSAVQTWSRLLKNSVTKLYCSSKSGHEELLKMCPKLEALSINYSRCDVIHNLAVSDSWPINLKKLTLKGVTYSPSIIELFEKHGNKLTSITLAFDHLITDYELHKVFSVLKEQCENLLNLTLCSFYVVNVSRDTFIDFVKVRGMQLKRFEIQHLVISVDGLGALATHGSKMREISGGTYTVSKRKQADAIEDLKEKLSSMPSLEEARFQLVFPPLVGGRKKDVMKRCHYVNKRFAVTEITELGRTSRRRKFTDLI
ncbi:hypothetical protein HDE_10658 [Halotydeus destructor]|nr:hypothetical protein HDE_10658 [Halotydeus destructor]